jgi:N-acetylglucosamine malate deacetylase 1
MNVLAVGAHPDDLEILCGGTLAKYVSLGHNVVMAHFCNGNKGHHHIPPDELSETRDREALESSSVIGARHINLDIDDLDAYVEREQVLKCVDLIRQSEPDVIITHSPEDYMPDHTVSARIVFDASFVATLPHVKTEYKHFDRVTPIYYMDTLAGINFKPSEYVDITDTFETKKKMLSCHRSQLDWLKEHDKVDILDFIRKTAEFRGLQCGAVFAEAFSRVEKWGRNPSKRLLP